MLRLFDYSGQIFNSEATPQRSLPTCYSRGMGSSSPVRVHRLWKTVSFTFGSRHQFRITEYHGKIPPINSHRLTASLFHELSISQTGNTRLVPIFVYIYMYIRFYCLANPVTIIRKMISSRVLLLC